jgi:class 3 adenylate cyclase/tetratricopeptide (TPR) repeat protein
MSCPRCGYENPHGARFCGECAQPLVEPLRCPKCGASNPNEQKFCNTCAGPLGGAASRQAGNEPAKYTPRHLAEKILSSRSALEGERKQVTILFADVRGSTQLASQIDPEEWHGIMDRFFRILGEGVHRFEGTVNEYRGDGIMALFGAPIAHEDHAQRACYAALHLREELRRYADELRIAKAINFSVRMGINSGEVVVGKIGDDLRMDYTALGHTANLAARMEQIAEPGKIYLAEATARLNDGFFVLRDLGRHEAKGIARPVGVFELESAGAVHTRLEAAERKGFSRFVGRHAEMQTLEGALDSAIGGDARVVGVVGEPGVGKSRLCREFVTRVVSRRISVYEGHCPAHGKTIPFIPVLQLFRSYFGITERDSARDARRKIAGGLLLLDECFREVLPLVFEFLAVPDSENPSPPVDPQAKQRQLYAFLRSLVRARSRAEPAVVLVDDLHWVDGASDAFLAELAEAIDGTRTLLLVNFRPEYSAAWMRKSSYQQIALRPLVPRELEELITDLIGGDPSLSGLSERIRERTGGNPFFVEEMVQDLAESAKLDGRRGSYRLSVPLAALHLPATVQTVLAARIDRLSEDEKRTLQAAAVIGKNFLGRVLDEVIGSRNGHLAAALSALRDKELVFEERLFPEAEYAFKHPLTQEVAYQSQLESRRRVVHASVAQAVERLYPEKLDERAALLAHHWECAARCEEAARWHARAADWAGANDPGEALRHWLKVRDLVRQVPESDGAASLALNAYARIIQFAFYQGLAKGEVRAILAEGRQLAERARNPTALANLVMQYALVLFTGDAPLAALESLEETRKLAEPIDDPVLHVGVRFYLSCASHHVGRLRDALRWNSECLEVNRRDPTAYTKNLGVSSGFILGIRGWIFAELGQLRQAEEALRRCEDEARSLGDNQVLCWTHAIWVHLCELAGDAREIQRHGQQTVEAAERTRGSFALAFAHSRNGAALVMNRRWQEAIACLEHSLRISRESGAGLLFQGMSLTSLALAHLGLGEQERALSAAEEAVSVCQLMSTQAWECGAQLARQRALRAIDCIGNRAEIDRALARVALLIEETAARAYEPFLHEEYAALAAVDGDDVERRRALREAYRLFTGIGATGHAERIALQLEGSR